MQRRHACGIALVALALGAPAGASEPSVLRAQVTAARQAVLAAPMTGRITQVTARDGERFTADQVLVSFDCAVQQAELARERATLGKRRKVLQVSSQLKALGSGSGLSEQVSAAEVQESEAVVRLMQVGVERCSVKAPFAGRVTAVAARAHQFTSEGAPLIEIVDDSELELELVAPSSWLAWMRQGAAFELSVDETGATYAAELTRWSGQVDPVSQSIRIYGKLTGDTTGLMPGMSGSARFQPPADQ